MALNIAKYASRLKEKEEGAKASEFAKLLWKPEEGQQTIRIIPYKFDPDNTIIELKFYYKFAGTNKTFLAPCTFGKPDPILEAVETLRSGGSDADKKLAKEFSPVTRYYVPIIVRGQEEKGVKFWGFGVQTWTQLVKLVTNPKWGDITSLIEGNDLDIEFHKVGNKKNAKGEAFPETTVIPCPQKTPAVSQSRRDLMKKLDEQTDILTIFPLKSYEELKSIMESYLNPDAEQDVAASSTPTSKSTTPVATNAPEEPAADENEFAKFFQKK